MLINSQMKKTSFLDEEKALHEGSYENIIQLFLS